ncbi:unnamed protein product [Vitrella brassicaformis CCMP3155]|uniref:peptidylprolyl isomerase n=1 Tax=Vitrella brassicaformis (strain CCMP3155) TaxID=1169540 RepID=A0A0G4EWW2_VITBC|nr:unnamed protein product [Vitrella brassicaformis CCMP3155]|eukprot:CEM02759.1 unnamed protein product [Vitrella brassicaformis CCMP3155]
MLLTCAIFLLASLGAASKEDLPADAPLRIGVKHKVPETECTVKSKSGDKLKMHYVGTLRKDGSEFDSSRGRNKPFEFTLGVGQVIKGWDNGLQNMCIGEKRKLTIPSGLGYGDRGAPPKIPGGATLVFEVELLDINNSKKGPGEEEDEEEEEEDEL